MLGCGSFLEPRYPLGDKKMLYPFNISGPKNPLDPPSLEANFKKMNKINFLEALVALIVFSDNSYFW
jgi:hypothetical protein